jgi:hypothetical protein
VLTAPVSVLISMVGRILVMVLYYVSKQCFLGVLQPRNAVDSVLHVNSSVHLRIWWHVFGDAFQ